MKRGDRLREELYDVLATRQRNVAMRTVMPFVVAAGFGALMGPSAERLWVWALLNAAVQLCEHALNRRLLSQPPAALTRADVAVVLARFVLGSVVFILGAAVVLATRMQLSPSLSVLIAAGALLNSIVVSRRSWPAFLTLNTPHFVYLLAMPVLMAAHKTGLVLAPAFGLGAFLLCACATLTWLSLSRALKSEAAAIAELERRRAEAEAARDSRAAFTAAVSHELRTPLSAILAAAAALEVRALNEHARDNAAMICDASLHMRRLLDDLLDLSKLEAGRMTVENADFDLHLLVAETLRFWEPEAAAKGLGLSVEGADTLPARVNGDAMRLRQVLNNLLSNAIKFTDRGEVRLELAAHAVDGGWSVRLAVADTGSGLGADAVERLFQPFEQVSTAVARTHGGTGLGLAISRELARLMGGDLHAEPRADRQGARFVLALTLPAAVAPSLPAGSAPDRSHPERSPAAAPRVLVVDDHALGRQALSVLLSLNGCDVRVCAAADEALEHLAEGRFDLVLTDLNMPGLDGRELTRRLRAGDGPNHDTPVLAVSGETGPEALASCLAAGMTGLAPKPLEPRVLYAAVDAALATGRGAAPSAEPSLAESAASSLSSHSQTVSTVQPPAANAA